MLAFVEEALGALQVHLVGRIPDISLERGAMWPSESSITRGSMSQLCAPPRMQPRIWMVVIGPGVARPVLEFGVRAGRHFQLLERVRGRRTVSAHPSPSSSAQLAVMIHRPE